LSSEKTLSVTKTSPDVAMMHSDVLLLQAREGDRHAQGKLMQVWYKRIYNFSYKFFYDHDIAMDVSQRTFISMHRNIAFLQDGARFRSWLYTIAVNCCREELRKRKSDRSVSLHDLNPGEAEDSYHWEASGIRAENPERVFRQNELSDLLHDCLLQLSVEQREVVIMKEYEGLKFREIAEALNISENTVKSRMYYGLEALKRIFEKKKITKEFLGYEL
jgi:RNA polymerase sigma-70 factor (ECF subfamily)